MKKDIHPKYKDTTFSCGCGATFTIGSTLKEDELKLDICSQCHLFYTGKQKLVDTEGRVEKFRAKLENAKKVQAEAVKKMKKKNHEDEDEDEIVEEVKKEEKIEKVKEVEEAKEDEKEEK